MNVTTNNFAHRDSAGNMSGNPGIVPLTALLMSVDHGSTEVANNTKCDLDMHKPFSCTRKFESCEPWQ